MVRHRTGKIHAVKFPQGSVLDPLLFKLFINDLPDAVKNGSNVTFYAGDTNIYRIINDAEDSVKPQELAREMACKLPS